MRTLKTLIILGLILVPLASAAQTASAPKALQLTVYNGNFALVKDTRNISLTSGINSIYIEDVAATIDQTSILFRSLTAPNSVSILEQNYQYDLISPENILNKSVGQRVTFTNFDQNGGMSTQSGILLNPPSNGGVVIRTDDNRIVMQPSGQVSLERMPDGLHPKPTLNWLLACEKAGGQDVEISYIANGIGWKADYVALVDGDDTALDLAGWVTLDNNSGASYPGAKLTLMAGDVRRVQDVVYDYAAKQELMAMASPAYVAQFEEKSFFEYHMYTMERPTDIGDRETKQLSLLNAANVPVKKEMIYDARGDWFRRWWHPGRGDYDPGSGYDTSNYHKVNVVLEVTNSEQNHMGMPLPKGKIRVYKLDESGSQQFVGEDTVDHTPKNEKIRLYIGDAFDVVGDYKRTNYRKIATNIVEESFEVVIRNHKKTAVEVKVVDDVWSDWKITETTHQFNTKDASTVECPVRVPADGEVKVVYTIRTKW